MKLAFPAALLLATLVVSPACHAQEPTGAAPAKPAQTQAQAASPLPSTPAPAPSNGMHRPTGGAMMPGLMAGMEPPDAETQAMQKELQKLQLQLQVRQMKLQAELAPLTEAGQKLQAQMQADGSNIALQKEVQKLQAEAALRQAKAQVELAAVTEEANRLQAKMGLERARRDATQAAAMEDVTRAQEKIALEKARRDVARAAASAAEEQANFELGQKLAESKRKNQEMAAEIERLSTEGQLAQAKLAAETSRLNLESKRLQTVLAVRDTKDKVAQQVLTEVEYPDQPFKDGVLTISDRRVELNGVIYDGSVKPVIEKIQFFANQSDKPIFLVIDSSPGGSVAAGYQVIKAMESSRAPVHVVVKSFAASMAACICTLAPHSYAYPNAIILHHQLSYGGAGRLNLTQQREQLDQASKWYQRLGAPIAKKMGVTVDEMVKEMYKHNSDGDWEQFADDAQKSHWVDNIVTEVHDMGVREMPKAERPMPMFMLKEQQDGSGRFVQLPRLDTYDCWFLHNRDGYYRN